MLKTRNFSCVHVTDRDGKLDDGEQYTTLVRSREGHEKHLFRTTGSLISGVEVENQRPAKELRQLHVASILILQNKRRQFVALRQLQTCTKPKSQTYKFLYKSINADSTWTKASSQINSWCILTNKPHNMKLFANTGNITNSIVRLRKNKATSLHITTIFLYPVKSIHIFTVLPLISERTEITSNILVTDRHYSQWDLFLISTHAYLQIQ